MPVKNTPVKVTVYIPSHNYGRFLQQAVESVLRQSMDDWELILVDDGSTDNSSEVMKIYSGDPRVRAVRTEGIGLPAVANVVLGMANGRYLIRLDGDDVFDENILLVLSNHLYRNPNVALVFPDYYLMDEAGNVFAQERREQLHYSNHSLDMPAHGACTMVRKEVLEKLGGYREDLGAQDGFDLWTRLTREYKPANVNVPLFYYRRHGENLTNKSSRILHARREIKKDACLEELEKYRPIVAVIPCRRYYDVRQDLWKERLNGVNLLDRAIQNCAGSALFDHIVVASDNPDVQQVMAKYDDKRLSFLPRRTEDTLRSRPITQTLESMINAMGIGWNGLSVLSYLQAPFSTTETLEEAIYTLVMNQADCSFAVNEVDNALYRRGEHGLEPVVTSKGFNSDFDTIYAEARTALATCNRNLKTGSLMGNRIVNFVVSRDEAFFIHTERDLEIARLMYHQEKAKAKIRKIA